MSLNKRTHTLTHTLTQTPCASAAPLYHVPITERCAIPVTVHMSSRHCHCCRVSLCYASLRQRERAVYYFRSALARLKEQHGEAISTPDDKFKVGVVLPRMTTLVLRCFARTPVSSDEDHSAAASTLHMFLTHLARLDYGLLHLNLGFRLQDFGAHAVSLQHMQEVLALQVCHVTPRTHTCDAKFRRLCLVWLVGWFVCWYCYPWMVSDLVSL